MLISSSKKAGYLIEVSHRFFKISLNFWTKMTLQLNMVRRILHEFNICGALRDLVAFAQFKKREKNPWRSATFSFRL